MLSLEHIEAKARLASADEPSSVRALTEEIVARSPFGSAPESLRGRLYRAEMSFRRGAQAVVLERDLATAINQEVARSRADAPDAVPDYMRTTEGQVRRVRTFLRRYVPHIVKTADGAPQAVRIASGLSPAEAVFVSIGLIHQKLVNPEYQVPPEEWEHSVEARERAVASAGWSVSTPVEPPRLSIGSRPAQRHPIHIDLRDESHEIVRRAHTFLDGLGFER
jgi:hypothetical protein